MSDINTFTFTGRVQPRDPETKHVGEKTLCKFTVAVKTGKDKTAWINCTAWEHNAKFVSEYVKRGAFVAITGSIQQDNWEGKDGQKKTALSVTVRDIQAPRTLESKPGERTEKPADVVLPDVDASFDRPGEDVPF